ncbi:E3 ubiquitin-protein transferase rmnd5b [Xenoophorus captivus]|uniref:E3 ubiquitin-protein transferase rmnd5b n=1 Tax=Xenoophorus captivus TaxID=1517983 RepID=A0ABV0R2W5_9TELE
MTQLVASLAHLALFFFLLVNLNGVWTHKDELPVSPSFNFCLSPPLHSAGTFSYFSLCLHVEIEIDLGKKCWYHSVFACPILRQQTSESNPPMKLICGHVISRDALNKLTNAGK